jgi:hypothetical protein
MSKAGVVPIGCGFAVVKDEDAMDLVPGMVTIT